MDAGKKATPGPQTDTEREMRRLKVWAAFQDKQISISAPSLSCCTSSIVCNEDLCFPPASIWHSNILSRTFFLSDLDFIYNRLEEQTNKTKDCRTPLYIKYLAAPHQVIKSVYK